MEDSLWQNKTVANSEFFADQNTQKEEIPLKSEDDGMRPVMEAVQLNLEMEKRKIREELIASEIARQQLEEEVRLELMVEKQMMGKSMVESSQEQILVQAKPSSGVTGMKRKAETSARASDEESASIASKGSEKRWYCSLCGVSATSEGALNLHLQGKKHKARETTEKEKTPVASKWHCSLCQVSATSETLLKAHLLGKKHKSKEAKLEPDQNISNMNDDSNEKSREVVGPGNTNVKTEAINKWYCSLCQVSASSEKNLDDHLQGKKHKAKEISNVDTNLADKVSELVETTREKSLEGGETPKVENSTPEVGNPQKGESENENETSLEASMDIYEVENVHYLKKEMSVESVKYWHCEMCNEGTCDEATMSAHRKSKEHMALLCKHGGGVIVVSRMSKEAVDGGKGAQE